MLLGKTSVSRYYVCVHITMHNMVIEDELMLMRSIIDLNMMFVLKVDMIVDKI